MRYCLEFRGVKRAILGWLAAPLLLFPNQAALAETAKPEPQASYILGVGKSDLFPYFGHCDGEFCGMSRKLLDQFASDMDLTLHYEITPVIRVQKQLKAGEIAAFFPDNPKWLEGAPERSQLIFSKPVIPYAEGMLILKEQKHAPVVTTYGVLYKWVLPSSAQDILAPDATRLDVDTTAALASLLLRKRVDAIYGNYGVARHDLMKMGYSADDIIPHAAVPLDEDHYFMSGLKNSKLLPLFEQWLERGGKKHVTMPMLPDMNSTENQTTSGR